MRLLSQASGSRGRDPEGGRGRGGQIEITSRPASSRAGPETERSRAMARIVVLGAGFAGLWAAIGAARKREEIGTAADILVIDRHPYHNIRVRNYEVDL